MLDPVTGVSFSDFQKLAAAGERVALAVAIQRPGQAAGPGAFGRQPLMRVLAQESPRFQIENALMSRGTVGTDELVASRPAMGGRDAGQVTVAALDGCIKNERH